MLSRLGWCGRRWGCCWRSRRAGIFGQIINPGTVKSAFEPATAAESNETPVMTPASDTAAADWDRRDWEADLFGGEDLADDESPSPANSVFNDEELIASPERSLAPPPDLLSHSPYPSFRSQQMDEKLALYHQRLAASGPPDVLIIGSSRALRGVDPAALQR